MSWGYPAGPNQSNQNLRQQRQAFTPTSVRSSVYIPVPVPAHDRYHYQKQKKQRYNGIPDGLIGIPPSGPKRWREQQQNQPAVTRRVSNPSSQALAMNMDGAPTESFSVPKDEDFSMASHEFPEPKPDLDDLRNSPIPGAGAEVSLNAARGIAWYKMELLPTQCVKSASNPGYREHRSSFLALKKKELANQCRVVTTGRWRDDGLSLDWLLDNSEGSFFSALPLNATPEELEVYKATEKSRLESESKHIVEIKEHSDRSFIQFIWKSIAPPPKRKRCDKFGSAPLSRPFAPTSISAILTPTLPNSFYVPSQAPAHLTEVKDDNDEIQVVQFCQTKPFRMQTEINELSEKDQAPLSGLEVERVSMKNEAKSANLEMPEISAAPARYVSTGPSHQRQRHSQNQRQASTSEPLNLPFASTPKSAAARPSRLSPEVLTWSSKSNSPTPSVEAASSSSYLRKQMAFSTLTPTSNVSSSIQFRTPTRKSMKALGKRPEHNVPADLSTVLDQLASIKQEREKEHREFLLRQTISQRKEEELRKQIALHTNDDSDDSDNDLPVAIDVIGLSESDSDDNTDAEEDDRSSESSEAEPEPELATRNKSQRKNVAAAMLREDGSRAPLSATSNPVAKLKDKKRLNEAIMGPYQYRLKDNRDLTLTPGAKDKNRKLVLSDELAIATTMKGHMSFFNRREPKRARIGVPFDLKLHTVKNYTVQDAILLDKNAIFIGYEPSGIPDSTQGIVPGDQGSLVTWDPDDVAGSLKHLVLPQRPHSRGVFAASRIDRISDQNFSWVTAGKDHNVQLWDVNADTGEGRTILLHSSHSSMVSSIAYSRQHNWVISGGRDCKAVAYDLADEAQELIAWTHKFDLQVLNVHVNEADGNLILFELSGHEDRFRLHDKRANNNTSPPLKFGYTKKNGTTSSNERGSFFMSEFAIGDADGCVRIWDLRHPSRPHSIKNMTKKSDRIVQVVHGKPRDFYTMSKKGLRSSQLSATQ